MGVRALLLLYLVGQALSLRALHLSTGSTAMTAADQSALIVFIVIGVVACLVVSVVIFWIFKDPYHRDAYLAGGQVQYQGTPYQGNPNQGAGYGKPNPFNNQYVGDGNPGYYRY